MKLETWVYVIYLLTLAMSLISEPHSLIIEDCHVGGRYFNHLFHANVGFLNSACDIHDPGRLTIIRIDITVIYCKIWNNQSLLRLYVVE